MLSDIPNLTPNQRRMATKLDSMCDALAQLANGEVALTADQTDLLTKCDGMRSATNTTANQVDAIEELIPDDFAVARTQTLLFANTQYASIMDRLMALRGGARGLSLAGLNIIVDGKLVPLAQLQEMVAGVASAAAPAPTSRADCSATSGACGRAATYSFGEKDASATSPASMPISGRSSAASTIASRTSRSSALRSRTAPPSVEFDRRRRRARHRLVGAVAVRLGVCGEELLLRRHRQRRQLELRRGAQHHLRRRHRAGDGRCGRRHRRHDAERRPVRRLRLPGRRPDAVTEPRLLLHRRDDRRLHRKRRRRPEPDL